ncbi:hypothetical protein KQI84_10445 [bacterium]|nr:hypothetical protein [bacterium]
MRLALIIPESTADFPPLEAGHLAAYVKAHCWWIEASLQGTAEDLPAADLAVEVGIFDDLHAAARVGVGPEGARALLEAVRLFNDKKSPSPEELEGIPGLRWRRDGKAVINPGTGGLEIVDSLPPADRELIGDDDPKIAHMQSHHCGHPFSPRRLVDEVAAIRKHQNPESIRIVDDRLVGDPARWSEFARRLHGRGLHKGIVFRAAVQPDRITPRVARELAAVNFRMLDWTTRDSKAERLCLRARARRSEADAARLQRQLDRLLGSRLVRIADRFRRK